MLRLQSGAARWSLISILILLLAARASAGHLISDRPIENREAMNAFYSSLRLTEAGETITRIIHYGDSHVAADLMTGAMRQMFHRDFGDAGTGFALAVRPWKWYSPVGGSIATSTGWRADGLSPTGDARFGLAGVCASADRAEEWIRLTAQGRYFDIYLLKQPGGGAIDVLLDGAIIHQGARLASNRFEPAYLEVGAEQSGTHTIEIKIATAGHVRLFGIAAESDIAGVSYDALGINGARAYLPLAWDWDVMADNFSRRDPGLIIIAYGSNEAGDSDFDTSEYAKRFAKMLARFQQAAPDSSILVISPPDRAVKTGKRWHSIKRLTSVVEAQRRAARAQGAAFWNLFEAMGGADSIDRWARLGFAQPDRVHLTRVGYRMVADAFYAQLMREYLRSVMTPLPKGRSFYGFSPMLSHPRANISVYFVSLLQRSNFYRQDFLTERASQSFKEPQSVTPVALVSFQALADSYGAHYMLGGRAAQRAIPTLHKCKGLLAESVKRTGGGAGAQPST